MISNDYYSLLKIDRTATDTDIKKAYRKLAMEWHPDINTQPDAEARFKAIGEAYSVLINPQKKLVYDQTGTTDFSEGASRTAGPAGSGRRGMCRGMGMGKCSGIDALFARRRPRYANETKEKPLPPR